MLHLRSRWRRAPEQAAPWEVDYWQHEVVLMHPSWLVRAMNSGLGLWETGQLTWLLAGFSRGISLLPSLHALPTVDSLLSSFLSFFPLVLVSCLLNRFELWNTPSMAHFLPFPKDPGHPMLCLPSSYVCFSTSVPSFRTLSPPFLRDQQHQEVLRWEQPTVCGVFVQGGVGVAWLTGQGRAEAQAPVLGSCVALSFPHLPFLLCPHPTSLP